LYIGPIVLKNNLNPKLCIHFMTLNVAIRILSSPEYIIDLIDYAEELLIHFVREFSLLYGEEFVSYNIHHLIHLAEDCRLYGILDTFSTFPFENSFQIIKRKLKKSTQPYIQLLLLLYIQPLVQLHNREVENSKILQCLPNTIDIPKLRRINNDSPFIDGVIGNSFKSVKIKQFKLTTYKPNNYCIVDDGSIILVENIIQTNNDKIILVCRKFLNVCDLFNCPMPSNVIGIFLCGGLSELILVNLINIKCKLYKC